MIIGIDLGTTNSLVGYWRDGEAYLIANLLGKYLTPSVVGLDDHGQVIVGEVARNRLQTHPALTSANFKRDMGTQKVAQLGDQTFRAEELSSLLLKALKADAEDFFGEPVAAAVISVPAYFSDAQRKATRNAGRLAGLQVDRIINEPTAAAIAYGLHQAEQDSTFLVFDLGGGTFDVSILELFDGVMQVHASTGDNHLGGEDYSNALAGHFMAEHGLTTGSDASGTAKLRQLFSNNGSGLQNDELARLQHAAEHCKRQLSQQRTATMRFVHQQQELSREQFEALCKGISARLVRPVERALRDADLTLADIDLLILVGGSTRMPLVRSLAARMLGKLPMAHINPDQVVARGAAVLAGMVSRDESLAEVVLTDVSPYSLGVAVHNENARGDDEQLFHPIIERNSPVPVSRVDDFYTAGEFQTDIELNIYQGEARLVRDNILLGSLALHVPPARQGAEGIDIRFTYDINGLLEVETKVHSTGRHKQLIIEGNPGVMTDRQIEQRLQELAQLKIHPRDSAENIALMARGERLYQQLLGESRDYLGGVLKEFEQLLERQHPAAITAARPQFEDIFNQLEISPLD